RRRRHTRSAGDWTSDVCSSDLCAQHATRGNMNLLSSLRSLVTALVNRGRIENDTDEELRAHVQNRADDLEHSGLTRAEAERRAGDRKSGGEGKSGEVGGGRIRR